MLSDVVRESHRGTHRRARIHCNIPSSQITTPFIPRRLSIATSFSRRARLSVSCSIYRVIYRCFRVKSALFLVTHDWPPTSQDGPGGPDDPRSYLRGNKYLQGTASCFVSSYNSCLCLCLCSHLPMAGLPHPALSCFRLGSGMSAVAESLINYARVRGVTIILRWP